MTIWPERAAVGCFWFGCQRCRVKKRVGAWLRASVPLTERIYDSLSNIFPTKQHVEMLLLPGCCPAGQPAQSGGRAGICHDFRALLCDSAWLLQPLSHGWLSPFPRFDLSVRRAAQSIDREDEGCNTRIGEHSIRRARACSECSTAQHRESLSVVLSTLTKAGFGVLLSCISTSKKQHTCSLSPSAVTSASRKPVLSNIAVERSQHSLTLHTLLCLAFTLSHRLATLQGSAARPVCFISVPHRISGIPGSTEQRLPLRSLVSAQSKHTLCQR